MTDPDKNFKDFKNLPEEYKNTEFLREQRRKSIPLASVFGAGSAYGWSHIYKMRTELKVNPQAYTRTDEIAIALPTLAGTGLTILGVAAIIKLKRLIRQGEELDKNRTNSSGPSP